jgi:hypothetical protein
MAKAHYAIWSEHNKLVFSYKTESASPRGKKISGNLFSCKTASATPHGKKI